MSETLGKLNLMNRLNSIYGIVGLLAIVEFSAPGAWKSFVAGWAVSVVNFEFLKRIGAMLTGNSDVKPMVYVLLVGKFMFWGAVIAALVLTQGIQPIAFVIGMLTILAAGLGLGVREIIYARA